MAKVIPQQTNLFSGRPIRQVFCSTLFEPEDYAGKKWRENGFIQVWNPYGGEARNTAIPQNLANALTFAFRTVKAGWTKNFVSAADIRWSCSQEGTLFFYPVHSTALQLQKLAKVAHGEFRRLMSEPTKMVEVAFDIPNRRESLED